MITSVVYRLDRYQSTDSMAFWSWMWCNKVVIAFHTLKTMFASRYLPEWFIVPARLQNLV